MVIHSVNERGLWDRRHQHGRNQIDRPAAFTAAAGVPSSSFYVILGVSQQPNVGGNTYAQGPQGEHFNFDGRNHGSAAFDVQHTFGATVSPALPGNWQHHPAFPPQTSQTMFAGKDCSEAMIESRKNMLCHNCERRHPPELCRGPLDERGLLNFCGFCGQKHLIDDCLQLKSLSALSQGLWKQYIIYESRRGLAPFATKEAYNISNFHGGPRLEVLNPEVAKWWERQVLVYDEMAGRLPYWHRFDWNSSTLKPTADLFNRLPQDPTIPPNLQRTGPPSHLAPNPTDPLAHWRTTSVYLNLKGCQEDELQYNPYWLLFESGRRFPEDTGLSIVKAQVELHKIKGQKMDFYTRLDWPESRASNPTS
ncbi:hypothetical protein PG997_012999 [Apiospora hydei]|uniref:Uncharacterized protein n=1 Tax=Apiospora hydei TaxID=1337664 RepID=A0ABR1V4Z4_9PEZI